MNGINNERPSTIYDNSETWNQNFSNSKTGSSGTLYESLNLNEDNSSSDVKIISTKYIELAARMNATYTRRYLYKNSYSNYSKSNIDYTTILTAKNSGTIYLQIIPNFRPCFTYNQA